MKKPSAVVDTNIFVSALILPRSKPAQLLLNWRRSTFSLVTSYPLLKELKTVLHRPKYSDRYHISHATKDNLFAYIKQNARFVSRLKKPRIKIRDNEDLLVLATALDGNADYLITGDKDLLILKNNPELNQLKIVTVEEFLKLLEKI